MNTIIKYTTLLVMVILISVSANAQTRPDDIKSNDTSKIAENYSEAPEYPGGTDAFVRFLKKRIHYPEDALKANVQGTVYISLIIDQKGNVTNVNVMKDPLGYGCGEEAARVIKKSRRWHPAKMNGKPVKVRYIIPVRFVLPQDN